MRVFENYEKDDVKNIPRTRNVSRAPVRTLAFNKRKNVRKFLTISSSRQSFFSRDFFLRDAKKFEDLFVVSQKRARTRSKLRRIIRGSSYRFLILNSRESLSVSKRLWPTRALGPIGPIHRKQAQKNFGYDRILSEGKET